MGIRSSLCGLGGGRSGVDLGSFLLPSLSSTKLCVSESLPWRLPSSCFKASSQLSATDVSARTTMKGAAKCDKHCDLQNSVNQQGFERILRFRDTPESMPASVSTFVSCRCLLITIVWWSLSRRECSSKWCVCALECLLPLG